MTRFATVHALIAAVLLAIGFGADAFAEPMFLAKQYTRCSTCHYSPSGGGLLTPYGRSLSDLELSTTKRARSASDPEIDPSAEEAFLYGALGDALGPLNLGIQLRPSHLRYAFGDFSDSRNLWMNADLIAAFHAGGWTAYGEIGRQPTRPEPTIDSYEYWVQYASARGVSVRAGRFLPAFGVRYADHTTLSRRALGLDSYDQVFGLEVSRATGRWLTQVAVGPGRADAILDDDGTQALTASARVQTDLSPTVVVVGSALYRGKSDREQRSSAVGGALGYAPLRRLTIWTEGTAYETSEGTSVILVNETSLEVTRGLWLKVSPQHRTGYGAVPGVSRWSASVVALPRTHWNANLTVYRERASGSPASLKTLLLQLFVYL